MLARRGFCALPVAGLAACRGATAPPTDAVVIGASFTIASRTLGETRRINVYRPPGFEARRLPALYMPDGGALEDFHHVSGIVQVSVMNGSMRPCVVVGIENTDRRRDLTGPTSAPEDVARVGATAGGSARFRRFIREELVPAVERRQAVTGERALIGESLAGLFALETMFREPDLFETYVAVSPSLWWDDQRLVRAAEPWLRAHADLRKTLFVAEEDPRDSGGLAGQLAAALRRAAPPGLRWHFVTLAERHATVFHPAALQALRTVLAPDAGA